LKDLIELMENLEGRTAGADWPHEILRYIKKER